VRARAQHTGSDYCKSLRQSYYNSTAKNHKHTKTRSILTFALRCFHFVFELSNEVEAVTLSVGNPPHKKYIVVKKPFNFETLLINYNHFHLTYIMKKFITSAHTIDNTYLGTLGCFTNVNACKRLGLLQTADIHNDGTTACTDSCINNRPPPTHH
jgi:hypothetical protein